jgi:hypothetical protein
MITYRRINEDTIEASAVSTTKIKISDLQKKTDDLRAVLSLTDDQIALAATFGMRSDGPARKLLEERLSEIEGRTIETPDGPCSMKKMIIQPKELQNEKLEPESREGRTAAVAD